MKSEHKHTWAEQDAFTSWRKVLCYLQRSGVRKSIKRDSHRYDRRVSKQRAIREQREEA